MPSRALRFEHDFMRKAFLGWWTGWIFGAAPGANIKGSVPMRGGSGVTRAILSDRSSARSTQTALRASLRPRFLE